MKESVCFPSLQKRTSFVLTDVVQTWVYFRGRDVRIIWLPATNSWVSWLEETHQAASKNQSESIKEQNIKGNTLNQRWPTLIFTRQ